jgi:hypothetical protein
MFHQNIFFLILFAEAIEENSYKQLIFFQKYKFSPLMIIIIYQEYKEASCGKD